MTRDEMIECGKNVGATHAIIYKDSPEQKHSYVEYVLPGNDADAVMAVCSKDACDIEMICVQI